MFVPALWKFSGYSEDVLAHKVPHYQTSNDLTSP